MCCVFFSLFGNISRDDGENNYIWKKTIWKKNENEYNILMDGFIYESNNNNNKWRGAAYLLACKQQDN